MKTKISISLFSCLWLVALILLDVPYFLPLLFAALLHECGHLLCAAALKIPIRSVKLSILGARISVDLSRLSYGRELLLALCGPLAGIIGALICFPLSHRLYAQHELSEALYYFSAISLFLSAFNLIPVESLDGGRMLRCTVSALFSPEAADSVMRISTFISLVLLWSLSVYMMLKALSGLTLFFFSSLLFAKFFVFTRKTRYLGRFSQI